MNNNREAVADYYERLTDSYLRYGGDTFGWHFGLWDEQTGSWAEALIRSNQVIVEGCDLRPGRLVLDAGCGVGGLAFYLAQTFGVKVIGVTICQPHVELAARLAREKGLDHLVEFRFIDFMQLDYPAESFDFVLNQETFCYVLNKEDYLRKIFQVLKPGGRWQTVDAFRNEKPLTEKQEEYHRHTQLGWKIAPLPRWQDIRDTLSASGFQDLCLKDLSPMAVPSALAFIFQARDRQKTLNQDACSLSPQEKVVMENAAAATGYSQGLIEGVFTYHLMGGAKRKS